MFWPHILYVVALSPVWLAPSTLMEKMIAPLQDKIEEWKKTAALLDKDHAKGEPELSHC